jgi:hypothetical protein
MRIKIKLQGTREQIADTLQECVDSLRDKMCILEPGMGYDFCIAKGEAKDSDAIGYMSVKRE